MASASGDRSVGSTKETQISSRNVARLRRWFRGAQSPLDGFFQPDPWRPMEFVADSAGAVVAVLGGAEDLAAGEDAGIGGGQAQDGAGGCGRHDQGLSGPEYRSRFRDFDAGGVILAES